MSNQFSALVLEQEDKKTLSAVQQIGAEQLPEGDVKVKVHYSGINYKDALAVTGTGRIINQFPFVSGIDYAGEVVESDSSDYQVGNSVVLTGWGVGERHWGGYAQFAKAKSKWLVPLPKKLTTAQAMIVGTAGFTAGLCVKAIVDAGVKPEQGDVVVTGASGGVGSFAVAMLANLGYCVVAVSQKSSEEYLTTLGAKSIVTREEMSSDCRPLEKSRWAAAVDTVGDKVLAKLLAEMNYDGVVAACGLAGGFKLTTTVMPFILRGVKLLGIDSVMCITEKRKSTWGFIGDTINNDQLDLIHNTEIGLADVPEYCKKILEGNLQGRVTVALHK